MIFCPGSQCLIPFENLYMNTVGVIQLRIWILFGSGGILAQKGIFFRENWLLYRESGQERVLYHWPGQSIDIQPQLSGDLIVWFSWCWWWYKLGRDDFRSLTWIFWPALKQDWLPRETLWTIWLLIVWVMVLHTPPQALPIWHYGHIANILKGHKSLD